MPIKIFLLCVVILEMVMMGFQDTLANFQEIFLFVSRRLRELGKWAGDRDYAGVKEEN